MILGIDVDGVVDRFTTTTNVLNFPNQNVLLIFTSLLVLTRTGHYLLKFGRDYIIQHILMNTKQTGAIEYFGSSPVTKK